MAKIFVCGDIVCKHVKDQFIAENIIRKIAEADYAVANLEGPINITRPEKNGVYQNQESIGLLKDAGFSMLLLANNHMGDYGRSSLKHTISTIEKYGLEYIGAGLDYDNVYQPKIVTIDNKTFAFINVCEAQPYYYHSSAQKYGYAWMGDRNMVERLGNLRKKADFIVAFVHAGLENVSLPLKYFKDYYHWLIDHGVDAVVGGHPHIPQGVEQYKKKLIVYSLGNFFFYPYLDENKYYAHENSSYSILLNFPSNINDEITYDCIYHKRVGGTVAMIPSSEASFSIDALSLMITASDYEIKHRALINNAYENLVKRLYRGCIHTISPDDSLLNKVKFIILYLFFPKRLRGDETAQKRIFVNLIVNETYNYIVHEQFNEAYAPETE